MSALVDLGPAMDKKPALFAHVQSFCNKHHISTMSALASLLLSVGLVVSRFNVVGVAVRAV